MDRVTKELELILSIKDTAFDAALKRIDKQLITLTTRLRTVDTMMKNWMTSFSAIGSAFTSFANGMNGVNTTSNMLAQNLKAMSSGVSGLSSNIKVVSSRIPMLTSNIKSVASGVSSLSSSLSKAQKTTSQMTTGLNSVNNAAKSTISGVVQTANSLRVFGQESGLLKTFAIIRSDLLLMAFAFRGVANVINESVEAFKQYQMNLTALRSISEKTVGSFGQVKQAAIDLTNKGFMSLSESSKALQNLLATGFNLEQSINILKSFGDFAAYNRQATYGWGEAVVVATEGVRLGLSTLSDACFVYDTPVVTENGIFKIGDIVENDLDLNVISYDFDKKEVVKKKIINKFNNGKKPVYKLTLDNGVELIQTGNHKFYKPDGTKKELLDFQIGEEIAWIESENIPNIQDDNNEKIVIKGSKVASIDFAGYADTYNITVEDFHRYFVGDGNSLVLSSNSGMTRNLGQLLESNGISAKRLSEVTSDATVRQALYNGIMQEAALVTGNAERALNGYAGVVAKSDLSVQMLKIHFGEMISPIFTDFYKGFETIVSGIKDYISINKDMLKLKTKEAFNEISDILKTITSAIILLTKSMVYLLSEFKSAITAFLSFKVVSYALTGIFTKLQPLITSIGIAIKSWQLYVQLGYVTSFSKAILALKSSLSVFGAATGVWITVISALVAAGVYVWQKYKNAQEEAFDAQEKRITGEMQGLRFQDAYLQKSREIINRDLASVQAKIKLTGATSALTEEENKLKKELESLDKSILDNAFALDKFQLALDSISLDRLKKNISELREETHYFSKDLPKAVDWVISAMSQFSAAPLDEKQTFRAPDFPGLDAVQKLRQSAQSLSREDVGGWKKLQEDAQKLNKSYTDAFQTIQKNSLAKGLLLPDEVVNSWKDVLGSISSLLDMAGKYTQIDLPPKKTDVADMEKYKKYADELTKKIAELMLTPMDFKLFQLDEEKKDFLNSLKEAGVAGKLLQQELTGWALYESAKRQQIFRDELFGMKELVNNNNPFKLIDEKATVDKGFIPQYIIEEAEYFKQVSKELSDSVKESFAGIGDAWIEIQTVIRNEEADTMSQLRKELQRGAIDQQEYALRVANAHEVAAAKTYNAWQSAGRNIFKTMSEFMTKMVIDSISKGQSIGNALQFAFNPSTLLGGLGAAAIGFGISYLGSQLFQDKSIPQYQDINPETASNESRRRMGSISQAAPIYLTITPTISIEGQQVFIGSGSVTEFEQEMSEMMIKTMQQAVDSQELDLSGVGPR